MKLELLPLDKTAVFARLPNGELIAYALCEVFRPSASKEEFAAHARRIVACVNAHDELLAALERLSFAAMCRENTAGDLCRLIQVQAELAAANREAIKAIVSAKGGET